MNYLLDTCVISELVAKQPNPKVVEWIDSIEETRLYLSVITIGEIRKGIEKLPDSQRKAALREWLRTNCSSALANGLCRWTPTGCCNGTTHGDP